MRVLFVVLIFSGLALSQTQVPTDPWGGEVGQACPLTKRTAGTHAGTPILTNAPAGVNATGLQTVQLADVTGITAGKTWITFDPGAAKIHVAGEVIATSDGVTTHYTYHLAHGAYILTSAVLKDGTSATTLGTDLGAGKIVGSGMSTNQAVALWDSYLTNSYSQPVAGSQSAVDEYVEIYLANPLTAGHTLTIDYDYTPAETVLVSAVDPVAKTVSGFFFNTHAAAANVAIGLWWLAEPTLNGTPTWVFCSPLGYVHYQFSLETFEYTGDTSQIDSSFRHTESLACAGTISGGNPTCTLAASGITSTGVSWVVQPESMAGIHNGSTVIFSSGASHGVKEPCYVTAIAATIFSCVPHQTHTNGFPIRGGGVVDATATAVDGNNTNPSTIGAGTFTVTVGSHTVQLTSASGWTDSSVTPAAVVEVNQGMTDQESALVTATNLSANPPTATITFAKSHTVSASAPLAFEGWANTSTLCGTSTAGANHSCSVEGNGGYFSGARIWSPQLLSRYMAQGYNWTGVVVDPLIPPLDTEKTGLHAYTTPDQSNPTKVPLVVWSQGTIYAQWDNFGYAKQAGCGGSGDFAVKDVMFGMASFNVSVFLYSQPDIYDPNYWAWRCGFLQNQVTIKGKENPWYIIDDDETDNLKWLGSPDFANWQTIDGVGGQHGGIVSIFTPYHISADGSAFGGKSTAANAYSDNLNHFKDAFRAYICGQVGSVYATVAALNAAWGSTYDTCGTDGTQSIITLTGSGVGPYTGTLAGFIDKGSIQVFDANGVIWAGDVPGVTSNGWTQLGTFQGVASAFPGVIQTTVTASSICYDSSTLQCSGRGGAISVTFSAVPTGPVTARWYSGGWCNGNGLMDECGQSAHRGWTGNGIGKTIDTSNILNDGNAAFQADMNNWLQTMSGYYAKTIMSTAHALLPYTLHIGPYATGSHSAPGRAPVYQGFCPYFDVVGVANNPTYEHKLAPKAGSTLPDTNAFDFINRVCGDVPISWTIFTTSQNDSDMAYLSATPNEDQPTQLLRATASSDPTTRNAGGSADFIQGMSTLVGATTHSITGASMFFFQQEDQYSGLTNFGVETLAGNPYDGQGPQCVGQPTYFLIGNFQYPRVPEVACYGDYVDSVFIAINSAENLLLGVSTPTAPNPTFNPAAGSYAGGQSVIVNCTAPSATILYTTDGSTPTDPPSGTTTSAAAPATVVVASTLTIQAMCKAPGFNDSPVVSAAYTITGGQCATPTFSPAGGPQSGAVTVTISTSTAGASIFYTTDGTTPTTSSTAYSGPFQLSQSGTIKAIAHKLALTDSAIGSASYQINPAPPVGQKKPTAIGVAH